MSRGSKRTVFVRKNVTTGRRRKYYTRGSRPVLRSLRYRVTYYIIIKLVRDRHGGGGVDKTRGVARSTQCDLWTGFVRLTSSSCVGHVQDIVKKKKYIGGYSRGLRSEGWTDRTREEEEEKKNTTEKTTSTKSYLRDVFVVFFSLP